jgi:PAS domain S-box-containing protein
MAEHRTPASGQLVDVLFDEAGVGLCLVAPDETILRVNAEWLRTMGYAGEQVVGEDIVELFPDTRERALALHARARAGERVKVPRHGQRVLGRYVWWEGSIAPVPMKGGTGLLITVREVTAEADASAGRYQLLFDTMLQGVVYQDADGKILSMNPAAERILGKTRAEFIGQTSVSVEHHTIREDGSSFPGLEHPSMVALRTGREQHDVVMGVFNPRQQGYRWISISAVPLFRRGEANAYQVYTLFDDITERKKGEEALRLRRHVTNTPLAVIEWDAATRVTSFSDRAEALFGWSADEVVGKRIHDIPWVPEEDWPAVQAVMRDLSLGARSTNVNTYRNLRKDGSIIYCEWYNSALHDAAGKLVSVLSLVLDVTARKRAEEALHERLTLQDQLAKVAVSVPGLISSYRLRPDGSACLPFSTPVAEEMFGISQEVLAKDISPFMANVHPDDVQTLKERIAESARTMSRFHDQFRYLHPTQGLRWIEVWSVPKPEPDGGVLWHGFAMDVTERKLAEEALRESDRRKSEFLAVLSHELRNPLAPIRNSIYLLERVPPSGEQAARAKAVIRRQTEHLTRLVDDLLDVTRISRGKIELQCARIDLRGVVQRTCDDHRTLFDGRHIELRVEIAGPVWIEGDATRIAQIVGNLLQNAAKFSREGGTVTVSVGMVDGQAELRVRDDGMGVAPDLLPRLFQPFVQAATGMARTKGGLGLGLALVKGLVQLHGGSVRACSEGPERGSEFVVTLPGAYAPRRSVAAPAARAAGHAAEILIIEDNVDAAHTIAEVLEMEGHRVHVATDGRSGLDRARELRPEIILCDIGLPDIDGYEIARRLRAEEAFRGTRLIAVSGYAQPEDRRRAEEAGFDAHVPKPAPLDVLLASVQSGSERRR